VEINVENLNAASNYSIKNEIPLKKADQFLAVSAVINAQNWNSSLEIRFSKDKESWSTWQKLKEDSHSKKEVGRYVTNLVFTEEGVQFFEIKKDFSTPVSGLSIHFYNPEKTGELRPQFQAQNRDACECNQPPIILREDWCPDGSCTPHPNPAQTDVTHLIVHHTATSNTSSDWAAVVRSIWDFHVNVNGWSDIGYNFLVDPEGNIYDGRGNDIRGAHFCGSNTGTMGTAMIGTFTDVIPADDALNSLRKLLAWKNCDKGLDALGAAFHASSGKTLFHISGHRDGCSTECPGNSFYPLFPILRQDIQTYVEEVCMDTGIKNPFLNGQTVQFFPNPTDGNLNFSVENELLGQLKILILDASLKEVVAPFEFFKDSKNQTFSLDLNSLNAGIYFLKLHQNGEEATFKVIKN
jgi:hypothetical protein